MRALTIESRARLRREIAMRFSDDELKTLCSDLGLDYENLPASARVGRARELVLCCERMNLLDELVEACQSERPAFPWSEIVHHEPLGSRKTGRLQGVYSSAHEVPPFASWSSFSSCGGIASRIHIEVLSDDGRDCGMGIRAMDRESVGVEKPIALLQGKFEFSYRIMHQAPDAPNVFFYAIPLRQPRGSYYAYLEVGSDTPDDSRNPFSPFRQRVVPPLKHYADSMWHGSELEFDFRDIPSAYYVVFAARINEGSPYVHPGEVMVKDVCILTPDVL